MKVVSIINMKGGCAKTTTAAIMAEALAETYKKRVLLFDNDKQGNMSNRRLSQVISTDYIRWKYLSQSAVNEVKAFYIGWHRRLSRAYFSSAMAGLK